MDGSTGWRAGSRGVARLLVTLLGTLVALAALGGAVRTAGLAAAPLADEAPLLLQAYPPHGAEQVPWEAAIDGSLAVTFSEPVTLTAAALQLSCDRSLDHVLTAQGGPITFSFISDRPFLPGESCSPVMFADGVSDHDLDDPPDLMVRNLTWTFHTKSVSILINELDAITVGGFHDFIELYDDGQGVTPLDGLTLVLYGGADASVYMAEELDGYMTDEAGYFVAGASGVAGRDFFLANDAVNDGPAAAAIYNAPATAFPHGAPVSTENLIDAVVYGPAGAELLVLLDEGQQSLDEGSRGVAAADSSQRCSDGNGHPRQTADFIQNTPTAGEDNRCHYDVPPEVIATTPADGATDVALHALIDVEFSEPVDLSPTPMTINCSATGPHSYSVTGDGTTFHFQPDEPLAKGETCVVTVLAEQISDSDTEDPPDNLEGNYNWQFQTENLVAEGILINEIDADTPGVDAAEFIELYDGGAGNTSLDGLAVVLFNGNDDRSYLTVDLDGYSTDAAGYFVLGNAAVAGSGATLPDGALQNGPDAAALVAGSEIDYPNGTPVTATDPIDAIIYSRPEDNDPGLQPLLLPDQPQVDENGRAAADAHSNQRCPNGAGGLRHTATYKQNTPTPGAVNDCITDLPPEVDGMNPGRGATGVGIDTLITVEFSEPVGVKKKWLTLACDHSGAHTIRTSGGPTIYTVEPGQPLAHAEECTATVVANQVSDSDLDDPPDLMEQEKSWSFTTVAAPADFVLINEIDPDTPSSDAAEFIELYDGGVGHTALDGLSLVFFNGSTNLSYRAIDLDGTVTDGDGYLLVGNAGVAPAIVFADGALQNGPDAVALYAADAAQFPTDSPIRQPGLLDAIVYGDAAAVTPQLLALLHTGQLPVNEAGRGAADLHALQRCPNGTGGQRQTASYLPNTPTPGEPSNCQTDDAPQISSVLPPAGANGVSVYSGLTVAFSEPVTLLTGAVSLSCAIGGAREVTTAGGPQAFTFTPSAPLPYNDQCQARITAARVSDGDAADPPDHLAQDYAWSFTTGSPPADFIVINELDADTPGSDAAEFIELYDGGIGHTDLAGLVVVLFNGSDDRSYFAADLTSAATNGAGFLLIGNSGVAGSAVSLPTGSLQNGADAVALYAGRATDFPNGTVLHTRGLLDAVVYGTADPADTGLLALLLNGEAQIDEAGRGAADQYSNGRCPDGAGGQRRSVAFRQDLPTPGTPNGCVADSAPAVESVFPEGGAADVALDDSLTITFTEDVVIDAGWYALSCEDSGAHQAATTGGPRHITLNPHTPFAPQETCVVKLFAAAIHDMDAVDPPDHPAADYAWSFTTAAAPADFVLINEIDADTPGSDTLEFVELYDGGTGHTDLSGLAVVFWNGGDDLSYRVIDLDGYRTGAAGLLVLGNAAVPGVDVSFSNGALQNGPDAVALLAGSAADFPSGTPLPTDRVIDAVVYGPAGSPDAALLELLDAGQVQIDEDARGAVEDDSLQRCPNGAGGPRHTDGYRAHVPTPGAANQCPADAPPTVVAVTPLDGATGIPPGAVLTVRFSEDVAPVGAWFAISCATSGTHGAAITGGPREFTLTPTMPFTAGEGCAVTLQAQAIHDADTDDPPDTLVADYRWSFQMASPTAEGLLINEIDANTPGTDRAEYIELYDGGAGHTSLDGLIIVLWNGSDDRAYQVIDLGGYRTDNSGYFTVGNADVNPGLEIPGGALQNGPDAVALYAGRAADFPAGATLTLAGLRDAVVYGAAEEPDAGLLPLLEPGEPQVDEDGRASAESDALQRCPDGAGGPRRTKQYRAHTPTPGATNHCPADAPPTVAAVTPLDGATGVLSTAVITISFSEDVAPVGAWFTISCAASGTHAAAITGGPREFTLTPDNAFGAGETCAVTLSGAAIHDTDADDPPDTMAANYHWSFHVAAPVAEGVLINEIDANTPGSDTLEFVELYDGGHGDTDLSGLVVVFWNGGDDLSYRAIDLDGYRTDAAGLLVLGNAAVPGVDLPFANGALQNGPDAVALLAGSAADFPSGTPMPANHVIDAVVYGPAASPDAALLELLNAGQPQIDEDARGTAENDSLQRCPDGGGGPRRTAAYRAHTPTPGAANHCPADAPPTVIEVSPPEGATGVAPEAAITIRFSEDVTPTGAWAAIACAASGIHDMVISGGLREFTLTPTTPFAAGEVCAVTIQAQAIHDTDADDPPDSLTVNYSWSFSVAASPATGILINELDADTPGSDRAEFIELYDGGVGHTALDGLVIVLWNGKDDRAYRAFDLSGHETDPAGYFVLGNADVEPGLVIPGGALQNGPDAAALYAGQAADFPTGVALTTAGLIDAVIYGPSDAPDAQLLPLLEPGQPQVDENGRDAAQTDSLQRCPDGSGGPRRTTAYRPVNPTPGAPNECAAPDTPPVIVAVNPPDGATGVAPDAVLSVTFDEDVTVAPGWLSLTCVASGPVSLITGGGPRVYTVTPAAPLPLGETCQARLSAADIHDSDADDPPDTPAADVAWTFTIAPTDMAPPLASFTVAGPLWLGQTAQFTNTTTGDGPPRYVWDFGDGSPSSNATHPSHRYAAPGRYTVTLTATNNGGGSTVTAIIEVLPRPIYLPFSAGNQ